MSDNTLKPPDASKARPIPASTSDSASYERMESTYSGSPSRASATARLATPVYGSPSNAQRAQRSEGQPQSEEPLASAVGGSLPGPGTSSLSQALRGALGQSPPRLGAPPQRQEGGFASPDRYTQRGAPGSWTPSSLGGQAQLGRSPRATEDIGVLRKHLVGPSQDESEPASYKRGNGSLLGRRQEGPADDGEFSSLQLQGGDITRHIYRYAEKREREQVEAEERESGRLRRSMSMGLRRADAEDDNISNIQKPGGFRRDHLRRTAASPTPSSTRQHLGPDYGTLHRGYTEPPRPKPQFITNNFVEFLTLYGHFAGEELDEDDEVLEHDEYFSSDNYDDATTTAEEGRSDDGHWGEDSALLTPGKRKRRRKAREAGKGTPFGAALLLLKSFVGTGVLFLPRAYLNGGMLFSNIVLLFIALLSYYCFILLVSVRLKVHASFGDMGGIIFGKHLRNLINFSLVISQLGFSSAYIVFVAENIQAFILAVSDCRTSINVQWVILMQMIIFLPLSLYRNINHIQKLALVADLFILLGLVYVYFYDVKTLVQQGGISDIQNFNPRDWTLFIGTAIFTFEGIGLIIPVQSAMAEPAKFTKVLGTVMIIISVVFISAGALSYAAYGSHTKTVILLNMPQDDKLVNGVQFIYSIAILLSTPLQIYPAIEITSQQLFSKTGKYNPWIKWQKNLFRFCMVVLCAGIAWLGANDLDKFVALVGSFACIPLVYIYPPMMHYRVVSTHIWQRVFDVVLVIFGICFMVYTTAMTVIQWVGGQSAHLPGYCDER